MSQNKNKRGKTTHQSKPSFSHSHLSSSITRPNFQDLILLRLIFLNYIKFVDGRILRNKNNEMFGQVGKASSHFCELQKHFRSTKDFTFQFIFLAQLKIAVPPSKKEDYIYFLNK